MFDEPKPSHLVRPFEGALAMVKPVEEPQPSKQLASNPWSALTARSETSICMVVTPKVRHREWRLWKSVRICVQQPCLRVKVSIPTKTLILEINPTNSVASSHPLTFGSKTPTHPRSEPQGLGRERHARGMTFS